METSDDPTTITAVATATAAAAAVHAATQGGGGSSSYGSTQAGQAQQTAEPAPALSEAVKRKRRLAASALTKPFAEPTLGTPGLLGL